MCSLGTSWCPLVAFGNREWKYSFECLASFICLNSQLTQFQGCGKMKLHFIWIMKRAFEVRISIVVWGSFAAFNHAGCLSYPCILCKVKKVKKLESILSRRIEMWGFFFFFAFFTSFFQKSVFDVNTIMKKKKKRAFSFLITFTLLQYSDFFW